MEQKYLSPYTESDYLGRFNLKALEKKLITSALRRTKELGKLSRLLHKPEMDVMVAIVRHRIPIA